MKVRGSSVRRQQRIGRLASSVTIVVLLFAAADARAASDLCGQTITQSLTLTADETCTGPGLIVGADGVTIDLGGFTLSGDGGTDEDGIDIGSHAKVTIVNGTVAGFFDGIVGGAGSVPQTIKLSRLTIRDNVRKGASVFPNTLIVDRSTFVNNGSGVSGSGGLELTGDAIKITSSVFVGNAGAGIFCLTGGKVTIANVVSALNANEGIAVDPFDTLKLQGTTVAQNGSNGIVASHGGPLKISGNTITANAGHGIELFADNEKGIVSGNEIDGNDMRGISVDASTNAIVTGNNLFGNGSNGVSVTTSVDVTVKGNTVVGNGNDGLSIGSDSTKLAKNVANANDGRGIFTSVSIIDGGGNTARANASLEQCSASIACVPAFTPGSGPVTPTCGMHVSTSVVLGADPSLCVASNGILVDADGITIDLNGHTLHGDRSGGTTGILVGSHANVTIKNGVVRGFEIGVAASLGHDVKLQNVELRDHVLYGATLGGGGVVVAKSTFVSNSGPGLYLFDATTAPKISGSFFVANSGAGVVSRASDTTLTSVTSTLNDGNGVQLEASGSGVVSKSVVARNVDGVHVEGPFAPVAITGTAAIANTGDGIVSTTNGTGVTIASSFVAANGGHGAHVGPSGQNTVAKNLLLANGDDGVLIEPTASTTLVTSNAAVANANSGIVVSTAVATIAKNLGRANLAIGIVATPGDIDGGGNRANHNAGNAQCVGPIACP